SLSPPLHRCGCTYRLPVGDQPCRLLVRKWLHLQAACLQVVARAWSQVATPLVGSLPMGTALTAMRACRLSASISRCRKNA
ncbi:hypothetical protein B296_00047153, partial [Ensete ventricosum]